MSRWTRGSAVQLMLALALAAVPIQAVAQSGAETGSEVADLIERGRRSYVTHCGACHGVEGKGDGAIAEYLTVPLPDLAGISARSAGEFPFDDIFDIVDGREVPGHGTRAMPVWGPAFMGLDPDTDKKAVKEKIVEVVYFLKSIQPALPIAPAKMGGEGG